MNGIELQRILCQKNIRKQQKEMNEMQFWNKI